VPPSSPPARPPPGPASKSGPKATDADSEGADRPPSQRVREAADAQRGWPASPSTAPEKHVRRGGSPWARGEHVRRAQYIAPLRLPVSHRYGCDHRALPEFSCKEGIAPDVSGRKAATCAIRGPARLANVAATTASVCHSTACSPSRRRCPADPAPTTRASGAEHVDADRLDDIPAREASGHHPRTDAAGRTPARKGQRPARWLAMRKRVVITKTPRELPGGGGPRQMRICRALGMG